MKITLNLTKREILILSKTIADTARKTKFNTVSLKEISNLSQDEKDYHSDLVSIFNQIALSVQYQGGL
tara:strand:- start:385 stop:588 length:204 start_codon:yes stop_codon:yes gene_type:complete